MPLDGSWPKVAQVSRKIAAALDSAIICNTAVTPADIIAEAAHFVADIYFDASTATPKFVKATRAKTFLFTFSADLLYFNLLSMITSDTPVATILEQY